MINKKIKLVMRKIHNYLMPFTLMLAIGQWGIWVYLQKLDRIGFIIITAMLYFALYHMLVKWDDD